MQEVNGPSFKTTSRLNKEKKLIIHNSLENKEFRENFAKDYGLCIGPKVGRKSIQGLVIKGQPFCEKMTGKGDLRPRTGSTQKMRSRAVSLE